MSTRPVRPADSRRRQMASERRRYGMTTFRAPTRLRITFGDDGEPTNLIVLDRAPSPIRPVVVRYGRSFASIDAASPDSPRPAA